ncbi:hypothetical protein MP228_004809 [Amoeboaphelidium protococcarum]|nr:hypothetical protein MP228_004809 [Amoeboaphelidium protococcarum]
MVIASTQKDTAEMQTNQNRVVRSSASNTSLSELHQRAVSGTSLKTAHPKHLRPFNTKEIKVLLLENISQLAVNAFKREGYQLEFHTKALPEDILKQKIADVHVIGIRSKTQLTADVLSHAKNLMVIGCFCIGTNQVDLNYASERGIATFNSPFSNSRSVAEMTISNIIALARQLGDRNNEMHRGVWNKVSAGCYEVRGKKLGIIGYGHIGSQLSVLAESMGMNVQFYDILQIMPIGCATSMDTLDQLLESSDFITLHVPATPETANMISDRELRKMRKGAYLINASRGNVVDVDALAAALKDGHIGGCAIDVYPSEPASNCKDFVSVLQNCPNTLLSPHIGGSTEEAQEAIGQEVSTYLMKYIGTGGSLGAVNFPECDLRMLNADEKMIRVCFVHQNVPGVLQQINKILGRFNIAKQISDSKGDVAYLMADVEVNEVFDDLKDIYDSITAIDQNILTRLLH